MSTRTDWAKPDSDLEQAIEDKRAAAIDVYRRDPDLIREHANQEDSYRTGGYADRQLFELVQNGADAILRSGRSGRIELRLCAGSLYCANEGDPFSKAGITAVTHAFLSPKDGDEIGRFGLGFKSVLSVTANPQIFSQSVCFEFNSPNSQLSLAEFSADGQDLPQLRVPSQMDNSAEFAADPILAEMSEWATTIIKLPNLLHVEKITTQLEKFKTEFLLFAPLVSALRLRIDELDLDLEHTREELGGGAVRISTPDGKPTEWLLAERMHRPSVEARQEVGKAIARETVKLTYAAPRHGRSELGSFWAYFPLADKTTATGLFNAPFRVTDDRTSLLPGTYNREIFEQFSEMFVEVLPRLSTAEDPAKHFDYLPARGKEIRGFGDRVLSLRIPVVAARSRIVPDLRGQLQHPRDLTTVSKFSFIDSRDFNRWQNAAKVSDIDLQIPHASCYTTPERKTRLRSLVDNGVIAGETRLPELDPAEWLTALGEKGNLRSLAVALQILLHMKTYEPALFRAAQAARIIPASNGTRRRADNISQLFIRGQKSAQLKDIEMIDPVFLEIEGVEQRLRTLGFRDVEPALELRALLNLASDDWQPKDWKVLWSLADDVDLRSQRDLFEEHVRKDKPLRVLARDGVWRRPSSVVLATREFEPNSLALCLDSRFHGGDPKFLGILGVVCGVEDRCPAEGQKLFQEYQAWVNEDFKAELVRSATSSSGTSGFAESYGPGPADYLQLLRAENDFPALIQWSTLLLKADAPREWTMTRSGGSFTKKYPAFHIWALRKLGLFRTSWGESGSKESLDPTLHRYSDYLPVASDSAAGRLGLPNELSQVPAPIWTAFLNRSVERADPASLAELVQRAVKRLPLSLTISEIPAYVGGRGEPKPVGEVLIAETAQEIAFLKAKGVPFIQTEDDAVAAYLSGRLGLRLARDHMSFSLVTEGLNESFLAVDRFRSLRTLHGNPVRDVQLVECERIAKRVTSGEGVEDNPIQALRQGNTLYVKRGMDEFELLAIVNSEFALGLSGADLMRLLKASEELDVQHLIERCKAENAPVRKLLILFRADELEARLPKGLVSAVRRMGAPTGSADVAQLFLNVYGNDSLQQLRAELQEKGLPAPDRWAGGTDALAFVRRLGFEEVFAGERTKSLESSLQILGTPGLNTLHDYQEKLSSQIRELLATRTEEQARKAMLYLPTGAGKTRVTVEAVVRAFIEDGLEGPVLWIAQSEELCEQAVQTWSAVWRQFADTRTLSIGRLWSSNEVSYSGGELSVVVATDAKLASLISRGDEYEWLSKATAVIIDEAHVAGDSPRYTQILRWLRVDGRNSRVPLLGLTATPFKGLSEARTESLAARFGRKRLESLGDDPYGVLQEMGVLSRVRHELLDGGEVELNPEERAEASKSSRISPAVLERLGADQDRTLRLVDHISGLNRSWPILVFTASVLSAQVLAALLQAKGISASSVSGNTKMGERRRILREFQTGAIQVLTNCDVLTQGFDAPGVKALYLARPTFSPNAYIQMVGRGLRGPLNGGKEECLIVDVVDTFSNFQGDLAFRQFDYLWDR